MHGDIGSVNVIVYVEPVVFVGGLLINGRLSDRDMYVTLLHISLV